MLRTRILTVLVMLPLFLGALFLLPPVGWALFTLALALIAAREWGRIARLPVPASAICTALLATLAVLWWRAGDAQSSWFRAAALASLAFWILAAPIWLGRLAHPRSPVLGVVTGLLVLLPTWLALVVLRDISPWAVLETAAVIWISDSAAYFAGRRFGRHRLAPQVSPGKTWEGVAGALLAVSAFGMLLLAVSAPDGARFAARLGLWSIPAFIVLAILGIEGDLFESWMKRGAGLKDSGSILPGHGGILDRIDALTAALPAAALLLASGSALVKSA